MRRSVLAVMLVLLVALPALAFPPAGGRGGGPGGGPGGPGPGLDLWGDLDFQPVVGHWAEYEMTPEDEKPMKMRISIVGKEDEAYWYESVMTGPDGQQMVSKMLVSGDPSETDNIKRMIVKAEGQPAIEMPVEMLKMGEMGAMGETGEPDGEAPETAVSELGVESVTVLAGTFDAKHWQFASDGETFDAWVKAGVGPYGLIKSVAEEFVMVLVAHGEDAKTAITEEPQKMPAMGFPMKGMGGK